MIRMRGETDFPRVQGAKGVTQTNDKNIVIFIQYLYDFRWNAIRMIAQHHTAATQAYGAIILIALQWIGYKFM